MSHGAAEREPRRVLIVEDDEGLSDLIARHLRARGHETWVAGSAEDAVLALRGGFVPSVVVLDINLPGDTGWSLLRDGILDRLGSPAVVVVSATHVPPSRLREFGVAGFLPKPFALATLVDVVERGACPDDGLGLEEALDAR
jgi:two-component system chemotaxis sensor kinase CheA